MLYALIKSNGLCAVKAPAFVIVPAHYNGNIDIQHYQYYCMIHTLFN